MSMEHQMKAKPKASFMPASSGLMRRNCDKCSESNHEYQPTSRQLLNIETSAIEPPHFSHDFSQVNIGLQCKPIISQPGDALEEEADRVAEAVVGKGISEPLLTHAKGVPAIQCQGQSSPQPSQEEQYKNAAEKAGEAFLKTNLGRDIKDKALKQGKDFISTLRGKIITGAAAAGVVSTLAATNSKLPMQVPEIPLDFIAPGLKVKLNYEGPVRNPTSASLTFTYVEQVEKKERKGEPTEREKFRAETARIAEDQAKFREGLKTPEQRAAEQEQFMNAYWARKNRLGLDPIRTPGLVDDEGKKSSLQMRDVRPKRDEEGLQRKAEGSKPLAGIPPIVHEVLRSPGQPLEPDTRAFMEPCFGRDFSRVRVHSDGKAADSTWAINALAYTIGNDVVFGDSQYSPGTAKGMKLIAHELAHVVQQGPSSTVFNKPLRTTDPQESAEREADNASSDFLTYGVSSLEYLLGSVISRQVRKGLSNSPTTDRRTAVDFRGREIKRIIKEKDSELYALIEKNRFNDDYREAARSVVNGKPIVFLLSISTLGSVSNQFRKPIVRQSKDKDEHYMKIILNTEIKRPEPEELVRSRNPQEAADKKYAEILYHELLHAHLYINRAMHGGAAEQQGSSPMQATYSQIENVANSPQLIKERNDVKSAIGGETLELERKYQIVLEEKAVYQRELAVFERNVHNYKIASVVAKDVIGESHPQFSNLAQAIQRLYDRIDGELVGPLPEFSPTPDSSGFERSDPAQLK